MDTVAIPLLSAVAKPTVVDAIDLLEQRRRCGLVLERVEEYTLFYIRHLLEARRDQTKLLAEVPGGYPVHILRQEDMQSFGLDLVRPQRTAVKYQDFFAKSPVIQAKDYLLAGVTADTAMVVTRHEGQTNMLGSPGGFQCNGVDVVHFFPDPDVYDRQPCPKYPECRLLGGGQPIVSPV